MQNQSDFHVGNKGLKPTWFRAKTTTVHKPVDNIDQNKSLRREYSNYKLRRHRGLLYFSMLLAIKGQNFFYQNISFYVTDICLKYEYFPFSGSWYTEGTYNFLEIYYKSDPVFK